MLHRLIFPLAILLAAFAFAAPAAHAQELANDERAALAALESGDLETVRGGEREAAHDAPAGSELQALETAQTEAKELETLRGGVDGGTAIILFTLGLFLVVLIVAAWQMA